MRAIEHHGIERGANNPNKGVNTRKYLYSIGVAMVIIMIGMLLYAWHYAASDHPEGAPLHATDHSMIAPAARATFC